MIVIAGAIPINGAKRNEVTQAVNAMREATLAEDGCGEYRFSYATDDPDMLLIVEEWRDQDALDAHFLTTHMATLQAQIPQFVAGVPNVAKYEVASKGKM